MKFRMLATFIFFTRLPFWRITTVPSEYFKKVVSGWPLVGWLTGGISAGVFVVSSFLLPVEIAILFMIGSRLLLTGCLHEDGLADFMDGFGGGNDKDRILSIMKDSHIGSYGVIGLIVYFLFYFFLIRSMPVSLAAFAILAGDPFCKGVSAMIINRLPYARKAEESKARTVYSRMTYKEYLFTTTCCLLPLYWLPETYYLLSTLPVVITWYGLTSFMKKKIQGYTGDCCGATVLCCEITFYTGIVFLYKMHNVITLS